MQIISDVHGAFSALRRVASSAGPLLILGDLVNFVDYRTGDGMVCDVFGSDFVKQVAAFRASGDYVASRELWVEGAKRIGADVRALFREALLAQYQEMALALTGAHAYVTFGNVDTPELLAEALPDGCRYVDGESIEIEGWTVGFVGGGAPSPLGTPGEITEVDMESKLDALGPVDILCTHLPPAVEPLRFDTVANRIEGSSEAISRYLDEFAPAYHYFGDVHQPKASQWRIGETLSRNVGYFRATGRPTFHPARLNADS